VVLVVVLALIMFHIVAVREHQDKVLLAVQIIVLHLTHREVEVVLGRLD
jgi:hypothetical protein